MAAKPAKPADEISPRKLLAVTALQLAVFVGLGLLLWHLSGRDIGDFVSFYRTEALLGLALAGGFIALAAAIFLIFPDFRERVVRLQAPHLALFG